MGNRLHIAKKYDVQFASIEHFNWQCEQLHDLLNSLGIEYSGDQYDYNFEVAKEDWFAGMEKLRTISSIDLDERESIIESLENLDLTPAECYKIFSDYYDAADPNNPYMYFSFY